MTHSRKGFTLIELLVICVIIGVLAAIAIPAYGKTKQKAYVASMQSDLRNLVAIQEAYFADNGSQYAPQVTDLSTVYHASSGVSVTIEVATGSQWSATATHVATPVGCKISLGNGATSEGVPVCQ